VTLAVLAQLAPALLLLVTLLAGRYPGERVLLRLAARRPRRRRRVHVAVARRSRSAWVRAGALIGRHLAVRPPPAAAGAG